MQYLRYEVVLYTAELADTKRLNDRTNRTKGGVAHSFTVATAHHKQSGRVD